MRFTFFALVAALSASSAHAQFGNLPWTLKGEPNGIATISAAGIHIVTSNVSPCVAPQGGLTYFEAIAPLSGTVKVRLDFVNQDTWGQPEVFENAVVLVNGVVTFVTPLGAGPLNDTHADVTFHVDAGDTFGLGAWGVACNGGPSVTDFTLFTFTPDALPSLGDPTLYARYGKKNEAFGTAVAGADVDGDGLAESIVGAPQAPGGGAVYVYSGLTGTQLYVLPSPQSGSSFGAAVANLGDVDQDGCDDLAIGAPLWTSAGQAVGAVFARSGQTGAPLWQRSGPGADDQFGQCVANAGDVDGDGTNDVVTGAPGPGFATAHVFSGATGAPRFTLQPPTSSPNSFFGIAVSTAADANADGFDDVAVGAVFDNAGTPQGGSVRVFSSATQQVLTTVYGSVGAGFGGSIATAGDLDHDGVVDLIACSKTQTIAQGAVKVFSAASGLSLLDLSTSPFGFLRVAHVGATDDVDGDGTPDLLLALVSAAGTVRVVSGATGGEILSIPIAPPGVTSTMSFSLRAMGIPDVNGDGIGDVVVGSKENFDSQVNPGQFGYGRALVASAWCSPASKIGTSCTATTGSTPRLEAGNCIARGATTELRLLDGDGGALTLIAFATQTSGTPLGLGCSAYLTAPMFVFSIQALPGLGVGHGALSIVAALPPIGPYALYLQAFMSDAAHPNGFVATNAVKIDVR